MRSTFAAAPATLAPFAATTASSLRSRISPGAGSSAARSLSGSVVAPVSVVSGCAVSGTVGAAVVVGLVGSGASVVVGGMIVASTGTLSGSPAMATPAPIDSSPTTT